MEVCFINLWWWFLTKLEIPYMENMSTASLLRLKVNGSCIYFGPVEKVRLEESKKVIRTEGCSVSWKKL